MTLTTNDFAAAPAQCAAARSAIAAAEEFLTAGGAVAAEIGRRVRRGDVAASMRPLLELLDGLGGLARLVANLERAAPAQPGRQSVELAELTGVLREIVARLEHGDWERLAEFFEFHCRRRFENWRDALGRLAAELPR